MTLETNPGYHVPKTPEQIAALSDEDFKTRYPENGFGWVQPEPISSEYVAGYELSQAILKRWKELREKLDTDRFN